jgi:hypothetical protein
MSAQSLTGRTVERFISRSIMAVAATDRVGKALGVKRPKFQQATFPHEYAGKKFRITIRVELAEGGR